MEQTFSAMQWDLYAEWLEKCENVRKPKEDPAFFHTAGTGKGRSRE